MFVDWWVVLIWAMLHKLMCSNAHVYMYASSICIFCAIIPNKIPQEAGNVSIWMCMHDCNFEEDVCVWLMSTLLWTCPQNHRHVDGLNVGSISCYFILQITFLGVYKSNLCLCVIFLHTPRIFFRLQPICRVSLPSVGFENVDVFLSKCTLQKWP